MYELCGYMLEEQQKEGEKLVQTVRVNLAYELFNDVRILAL